MTGKLRFAAEQQTEFAAQVRSQTEFGNEGSTPQHEWWVKGRPN